MLKVKIGSSNNLQVYSQFYNYEELKTLSRFGFSIINSISRKENCTD